MDPWTPNSSHRSRWPTPSGGCFAETSLCKACFRFVQDSLFFTCLSWVVASSCEVNRAHFNHRDSSQCLALSKEHCSICDLYMSLYPQETFYHNSEGLLKSEWCEGPTLRCPFAFGGNFCRRIHSDFIEDDMTWTFTDMGICRIEGLQSQ